MSDRRRDREWRNRPRLVYYTMSEIVLIALIEDAKGAARGGARAEATVELGRRLLR